MSTQQTVAVKLLSFEIEALQALDPYLSLAAIIRVMLGDPPNPGRGLPPPGGQKRGVVTVRISDKLSAQIDERCELDDYSRSDAVRVMLGFPAMKRDPVFRIRRPLQVNGAFKVGKEVIRPFFVSNELTQKFWVPVPGRITRITKSLRTHLSLLGIKTRKDEPAVVVLPGRKGSRSASIWLTDAEVERLDQLAANEGMAFVEFLAGAIFGQPKDVEDRCELGEAA